MKRLFSIFALLVAISLFVLTGIFLYTKAVGQQEVVETERPFYTTIIKEIVVSGTIRPRNKVAVKPKVSGIIHEIMVKPGDKVEKNDLIARISVVPNAVQLSEAESQLQQAQLVFQDAKQQRHRQQQLFDRKIIAAKEFEGYELEYKKALENRQAAQDKLQLIRNGSSAHSRYRSTEVRATVSGTVLNFPVEEGGSVIEANTYNEGTTIATIANLDDMIFEGEIDQAEVGKLEEGMGLILHVAALGEDSLKATLEFIAPEGEEKEGTTTFAINAWILPDKYHRLKAGYSANAHIILGKKSRVLAIDERLLQYDQQKKPYVQIATDLDTLTKKYVTLGLSNGMHVEVDGLEKDAAIRVPEAYSHL